LRCERAVSELAIRAKVAMESSTPEHKAFSLSCERCVRTLNGAAFAVRWDRGAASYARAREPDLPRTARASSRPQQQPAFRIADRYEVEAKLGTGGSGQVFRVLDTATGQKLALKRLESQREGMAELFELEYQALASLKHPRIVEVFEYGRTGDSPYYTMELLEGDDLSVRAPVAWREACRYLRDAAHALDLLHARKLIHRDVSPRNLWRTPDGRVKLIDFGAVTPFGPSDHVLGTPPLVPPEALDGLPLDQRSDLYALGAVAYYLLTGEHAFPARSLGELRHAWEHAPTAPGLIVKLARQQALEPVPPELDALIAALLSRDKLARPSSAAEVMDLLDVLMGTMRQTDRGEVLLPSSAFVGRTGECRRLRGQLTLAAKGRGQCGLVESESGLGRTRLLHELSLWSRVADAIVLHVDAASAPGLFGVANALALKLLDAHPQRAAVLAAPHAGALAHLSPRVAARLDAVPRAAPEGFGELRAQVQTALRDWFQAVSQEHTLVVLVDGLELCDEGSSAFLLTLALARRTARLLVVCTLLTAPGQPLGTVECAFARLANRLRLKPLSEDDSLELLRSLFGDAEHLTRLGSRLHAVARGNPGHLLELVTQLVRRDVIGFANGTWLLPRELPDSLASSRELARVARLELLSDEARALGRVLSVPTGALSLELAEALARGADRELLWHLPELLTVEVVTRGEDGLRFVHEQLRAQLRSELADAQRASAQRVIAQHLLELPTAGVIERLQAGLHLLEIEDERGAAIVAQASLRITLAESDKLALALPLLERALGLLEARGRPGRELIALLAPLCVGGYYGDRRYAVRYGEPALAILQDLLGLSLARRLRPYLGGKLSLICGLLVAGLRARSRRKDARVPQFRDTLLLLFTCVATLSGSSVVCFDPDRAQRFADVLEPFAALGTKNVAGFMYLFCSAISQTVRDRHGENYARWQGILTTLEHSETIKGLPPKLLPRYLGGALYASGVLDAQRDDPHVLATAERLEALDGHHYRMTAHQIRALYYAHQGDAQRFDAYRELVEQHAIQQGSMWQYEAWIGPASAAIHLRTRDVMGAKRTSEQLMRLAQTIPSFELHASFHRGAYLLLRKRYAEALPWLEGCLQREPRSHIAWTLMHGGLARAYNGLGDYERARTTCERAIGPLDQGDLAFPALNLIVHTELAIAEAGLGHKREATRVIDELVLLHGPRKGPLTMSELHDAGVAVALLCDDERALQQHLEAALHWFRATGLSSLAQRGRELSASVEKRRAMPGDDDVDEASRALGARASERLALSRLRSSAPLERWAGALQALLESTRAASGRLYLLNASEELELVASSERDDLADELEPWLRSRVESASEDESTQLLEHAGPEVDEDLLELEGRSHRALLLWTPGSGAKRVLAVAVVSAPQGAPARCSPELLRAVADVCERAEARAS
jgi:tetratricopeptide (TPR) repeat protein